VRGGVRFLLGILEFLWCFVMVNRGEFVVDCVVNVVLLTVTFRGAENRTPFSTLFSVG
jgi:hypothetical protein